VAITVWGVDPSITEAQWADLHYTTDAGNWYETVADTGNALAPSAGNGVRETVIASGNCAAAGVLGKNTAAVSVFHDANATAINRFDYVVFNINWAGTNASGGTIVIRKGSTTSSTPPNLTQTAGTSWDIPLALVNVTPNVSTFTATQVNDVRPMRRRVLRYRQTPQPGQSMNAGVTTPRIIATQEVPNPGWPYRLRVNAQVKFNVLSGNGWGQIDVNVDGDSAEASSRAPKGNDGVAQLYYCGPVRTGPATVRLRMLPSTGMSEQLVTSSDFQDFFVEVEPA
jgi:hypothetical protein